MKQGPISGSPLSQLQEHKLRSSPSSRSRPTVLAGSLFAGVALAALSAGAAFAQAQAHESYEDPYGETEVDELVVVAGARTLPGSVAGDITPEVTISPAEIRAYGAANVTELLDSLAPQLSSGQGSGGRPVMLINGGRVSNFGEIRDLPTEAIARVEILPEEVSLKYGYPSDQKVVNFVLRQRFRARLVEASASTPTQGGGGEMVGGHAGLLRIRQGQRLMLDAKANQTASILESDRDIIGGDGPFRTLQPKSSNVALNAVYARPFGNGVSTSLNGSFETTESEARLGVSPLSPEALLRRSKGEDAQIAGSAAGAWNGWQWSSTAQVSRDVSRSDTDRVINGAPYSDWSKSVTTSAQADIVLNRALWEMPAGRASGAFTVRASTLDLQSDAWRNGAGQSSDLSRDIGQLRANLDLPLSRADEPLGRLSANLNADYQRLSDFGDLRTFGGGLNWTPIKPLRVLASFSRSDQAPSLNQLGDPLTVTPGSRIFDLTTGQSVEVTRISGGSATLEAGQRDVFKLGATYKPFEKTNLTLQANFVDSRTSDAVVAFPSASTQVEAAFPNRFVRDPAGNLIQVDARPVNFDRQERQELRWGFTYSRPVGPQMTPEQLAAMRQRAQEAREAQARQAQGGQAQGAQAQGGPAAAGSPAAPAAPQGERTSDQRPPAGGPPPGAGFGGPRGPGGAGGAGRGGFGGFGGGPRGGVFQLGLYHTYAFKDEIVIRPGLPTLDLLDGAAIGSGGGSSRNQIDLQANYSRAGLGAAMNAKWNSATHVIGGPLGEDLKFSDFTTVSLRLFADLGQQPIAREHRWLRGARATLSINNLFDERQQVSTRQGTTPVSYQPDLLDPVGRSVQLTIRKLIF